MAPLLKKADYAQRAFFDVAPSSIHIHDLIHEESHFADRTSDLVTGMLLLGVKARVITKVEASWYAVPFTIGAKLRTSVYRHEGNPLLGPDGGFITIKQHGFKGNNTAGLRASQYSLDDVDEAPGYEKWLSDVLFYGKTVDDSNLATSGEPIPKRKADGSRVPAHTNTIVSNPTTPGVPSPLPAQHHSTTSSRKRPRVSRALL